MALSTGQLPKCVSLYCICLYSVPAVAGGVELLCTLLSTPQVLRLVSDLCTVHSMSKTMSLSAMRKKFGSYYHVALILDLNESTIGRWKRVPPHHLDKLLAHPGGKLVRGGRRS